MVEAAIAIPVALLLFMGCLQFIQVGLANIVVKFAAYEAGRQAAMNGNDAGQQTAAEICRAVSSGATEFGMTNGSYTVTHHLASIFPIVKNVVIQQNCPAFLFETNGGDDEKLNP